MSASRIAVLTAVLVGVLAGCSGPQNKPVAEKKPATEAKKEPVLYTARQCLNQIEAQARLWSTDAKPFHIESDLTSESTGADGKSSIWHVWYASASRRLARTFTCSGSVEPHAPAMGVTRGVEMPYDPKFVVFDSFLVKTDSDKAFEVAQDHGGKVLLKDNPQQPVAYLVEMTRGETAPHWFVIYGKSVQDNKGIGVINATTGAFLRASKGKR